mmetsp:Transcript_168770/g.542427  ORF Transcript_168770/g.542427 Transcript_168770/m.542427 type:complete len:207 (+) Transcript_168770:224-844(+)
MPGYLDGSMLRLQRNGQATRWQNVPCTSRAQMTPVKNMRPCPSAFNLRSTPAGRLPKPTRATARRKTWPQGCRNPRERRVCTEGTPAEATWATACRDSAPEEPEQHDPLKRPRLAEERRSARLRAAPCTLLLRDCGTLGLSPPKRHQWAKPAPVASTSPAPSVWAPSSSSRNWTAPRSMAWCRPARTERQCSRCHRWSPRRWKPRC